MKLYPQRWKLNRENIFASKLNKDFLVDFYFPTNIPFGNVIHILIFNDGQILEEMNFFQILKSATRKDRSKETLLIVGVHASSDRLQEYGTINQENEYGQGKKVNAYQDFLFKDLLGHIRQKYSFATLDNLNIAGFSLGGLTAIDIAWNNAAYFSKIGIFSGSLWWRKTPDLVKGYSDSDRIMHDHIKSGRYQPHLKFFFECGTNDENNDRNNNGIIDSIDDTMDLINELELKGYAYETDIRYVQIENGQHNAATWGKCMPLFLEWVLSSN